MKPPASLEREYRQRLGLAKKHQITAPDITIDIAADGWLLVASPLGSFGLTFNEAYAEHSAVEMLRNLRLLTASIEEAITCLAARRFCAVYEEQYGTPPREDDN